MSEILQKIKKLEEEQHFLKEYILAQNKDNYGVERCEEILKIKKFVTSTDIANDALLKTRYTQKDSQNKLLSDFLASNADLKELRAGRGNKRYIFYKDDENYVRTQIRINKFKNRKNSSIQREYEDIKLYFQNYDKLSISVKEAHEILRKVFNIKDLYKRRRLLEDLTTDNVIIRIKNSRFILKED